MILPIADNDAFFRRMSLSCLLSQILMHSWAYDISNRCLILLSSLIPMSCWILNNLSFHISFAHVLTQGPRGAWVLKCWPSKPSALPCARTSRLCLVSVVHHTKVAPMLNWGSGLNSDFSTRVAESCFAIWTFIFCSFASNFILLSACFNSCDSVCFDCCDPELFTVFPCLWKCQKLNFNSIIVNSTFERT